MDGAQDALVGLIDWLSGDGVRLAVIVIGGTIAAYLLARVARALVGRLLRSGITSIEDREWDEARRIVPRLRTLELLVNRTITSVVMAIVLFLVAQDAGLRVEPLVASAGLVGIAIAFGSQTLVRDTLSGVFLLVDGTYYVGDYVRINTVEGVVADVSLRRTRLAGDDGTVHTIPNGAVTVVSNFTREVVHHSMSLRLQRDTPIETVEAVLLEVASELHGAPEVGDDLVIGPSIGGITAFRGSTYEVEVLSSVRPVLRRRWARLLNRRLLQGLERHGIELPD